MLNTFQSGIYFFNSAMKMKEDQTLLALRILYLSAFKRMLYGNLTLKCFTAESQLCHNSEEMLNVYAHEHVQRVNYMFMYQMITHIKM